MIIVKDNLRDLKKILNVVTLKVIYSNDIKGIWCITIENKDISKVVKVFKVYLNYDQLLDIWCVEELNVLVFNIMLVSTNTGSRLILKVNLREEEVISTLTDIYKSAGWLEREVYDLFGVISLGNKDLRRILLDYGFKGHPLRKSFPLMGYKELRYSEEDKRIISEDLELSQEIRDYNYIKTW